MIRYARPQRSRLADQLGSTDNTHLSRPIVDDIFPRDCWRWLELDLRDGDTSASSNGSSLRGEGERKGETETERFIGEGKG